MTRAWQSQNQIYQQARADFQPYQQLGYDALPELRRMLGLKPAATATPQSNATPQQQNLISGVQGMFGSAFNTAYPDQAGATATPGSSMFSSEFDTNQAKGGTLSPLAQWQLQEFNKNQNRQDAARGLSGSGGASARLGEGASAIAANDYQAQYQRIIDAIKIGQGAAGSAGNASSQYSSQIGQNAGTNIGLAIDNGNTQVQPVARTRNAAYGLYESAVADEYRNWG